MFLTFLTQTLLVQSLLISLESSYLLLLPLTYIPT